MADTADRRSEGKQRQSIAAIRDHNRYVRLKTAGLCTSCGAQEVKNRGICYSCGDKQVISTQRSGLRKFIRLVGIEPFDHEELERKFASFDKIELNEEQREFIQQLEYLVYEGRRGA